MKVRTDLHSLSGLAYSYPCIDSNFFGYLQAFRKLLSCLTVVYPLESRSMSSDFKSSALEHLYIRVSVVDVNVIIIAQFGVIPACNIVQDWAVVPSIDTFSVSWHIPILDELEFADRLLSEFLQPAFDELTAFVDGSQTDRYIGFKCIQGSSFMNYYSIYTEQCSLLCYHLIGTGYTCYWILFCIFCLDMLLTCLLGWVPKSKDGKLNSSKPP